MCPVLFGASKEMVQVNQPQGQLLSPHNPQDVGVHDENSAQRRHTDFDDYLQSQLTEDHLELFGNSGKRDQGRLSA